jgi:hypothetical protein
MPRVGDLTNCKIYKIISYTNADLVYYGHTCQTLAQRFSTHKSKSNKSRSKQIVDLGDAVILLVEEYPCLNENQARAREAFYILNNPCVNKNIPNRTQNESSKAWYEANKEARDAQIKKYDEDHKEQRKIYFKQYYQNKKTQTNNINNNNANQEIV